MTKSTFSGADSCVDVEFLLGFVRVSDSKQGVDGLGLVFTYPEWSAFLLGVKAGEFELPEVGQ